MLRNRSCCRLAIEAASTCFLCLWLTVYPCFYGWAGEDDGIIHCDLQTCIDMAFSNHPLVGLGEAGEASARSLFEMKRAERRPSLNLEGDLGYLDGEAITPFALLRGVTEEGVRQGNVSGSYYQAALGGEIPIYRDGALIGMPSSAVRHAQFGIGEKQWKSLALRTQVALEVAAVYIDILKSREALNASRKIIVLPSSDYELAKVRFQQHLISKNDFLTAQVRLATARRDLSLARLALKRSQEALRLLMGVEDAREVVVEDLPPSSASPPPVEELIPGILGDHPAIKAQQFKVQMSEEEVEKTRRELYPTVSIEAHYGFGDDFDGELNDQFITEMKLKAPLFDFGLHNRKVAYARSRAVEEERRLAESRLTLERQITEIYVRIEALEEENQLLADQIEQATEAVKLREEMVRQQLAYESELHDAQIALMKLRLSQSENAYDRKLACLQLELLSGRGDAGKP